MRNVEFLSAAIVMGAFLAAAPREARATQPLDEFLAHARTHSFDAREGRAATHQREAEVDTALGRLLPGFTARGIYTRNQFEVGFQSPTAGNIVIQPRNQLDAYLQLEVPLIDVGSIYRYKSAKKAAEAATEQEGATELVVAANVAKSYFQFVAASAIARSAAQSVTSAEANAKNVADRASAGAATELDKQRAVASVERARQDVADAELLRATAGRALETASGLSPTESTTFPEDNLEPEAPLDAWLARVGETPADRAARAQADAARTASSAASLTLLPTLGASAQQRFTNATGFANRSSIYLVQVGLTWHIDYAMLGQSRAQKAATEAAEVREERAKRAVADTVFDAFRRVEANIVKSRAARAQADAAAKAAELAQDRYAAGASTQLEVTQAQRDAFLAQAARIGADAELALSRTTLRIAAGTLPAAKRPQ